MKWLNATIDPDWTEAELSNTISMVENDRSGKLTLGVAVSIKLNDTVTLKPSVSYTLEYGNDFIGQREMPRYFFFQSQSNPSMEEGTRDGYTLRRLGDHVFFTTQIITY